MTGPRAYALGAAGVESVRRRAVAAMQELHFSQRMDDVLLRCSDVILLFGIGVFSGHGTYVGKHGTVMGIKNWYQLGYGMFELEFAPCFRGRLLLSY